MIKTGLTVGKFAPLHRGHHYLIETALKEMDQLIILVYDAPKHTNIPLNVRANWLRKLYPNVIVIEGWDVPTDIGWSDEIQTKHVDFIISHLDGIKIDAFYSSENYGIRMSLALGCENRIVDMDRSAINISGTDIRNDAYKFRNYLDPLVYEDFITTISILGAPKSGKTTLTETLADVFDTVFVADFEAHIRLINQKEGKLSEREYVYVVEEQLKNQKTKYFEANKYLFVDTNAISTNLNSNLNHHRTNPVIETFICETLWKYDLFLICDYNCAIGGNTSQVLYQNRLLGELKMRKIPYIILTGSIKQQVNQVKNILSKHNKYMNIMDLS